MHCASLVAQLVKSPPTMQRPHFDSWVRKTCWKGIGYPLQCSWASLVAQLVKNLPAMQETCVQSLSWEGPLRRERLPTPVFLGFPCGSAGKESACYAGDLGSIPGLGISPEDGNGYSTLQYSCLENFMDRGGWQDVVHGVTKSRT